MNKIHKVSGVLVEGKRILVRGDLDVDDLNNPRTDSVREVVKHLQRRGAVKIKVIGHTETKFKVVNDLRTEFPGVEFDDQLRVNAGEKNNDANFAQELAVDWDIYVNEAFATSHRKHASIVALPEVMKSQGKVVCMGLRFEREIEMLKNIFNAPSNPPLNSSVPLALRVRGGRYGGDTKRVLVIGGVKVDDKEKFAEDMKDKFMYVLKGGLLPGVKLRPDGLDISDEAIEEYKQKISEADVILAAGVMGKYEDVGSQKGTREVLTAISQSSAYKVAGGGDIEMAIDTFGLTEKFNWISVGGGAMLVYLGTGSLVGLESLINN